MKKAPTVAVSVTNDLTTDQRVQRSIAVLRERGYKVTFIGRQLPSSQLFKPSYLTIRFTLPFARGFGFYFSYNLRLLWHLLLKRYDLYWSNDLDTLLPNYLASKLWNKPLVYDSHEYFTGVPEIQERPVVKWVWQTLEAAIFPHLRWVITVNESIAQLYEQDYGIKPRVVRNIADRYLPEQLLSRAELQLPENAFILINQGSGINVDRGMEEMLAAMPHLPSDVVLLLVGKGDVLPQIQKQARAMGLEKRVLFVPPQPYRRMLHYTLQADCGLSLDKDTNVNYRYSLPNKIFDYLKCGLPMVCSGVPEVRHIVETYGLGEIAMHEPETLAQAVRQVRAKGKNAYREALQKAARENNWEKEQKVIADLLREVEIVNG